MILNRSNFINEIEEKFNTSLKTSVTLKNISKTFFDNNLMVKNSIGYSFFHTIEVNRALPEDVHYCNLEYRKIWFENIYTIEIRDFAFKIVRNFIMSQCFSNRDIHLQLFDFLIENAKIKDEKELFFRRIRNMYISYYYTHLKKQISLLNFKLLEYLKDISNKDLIVEDVNLYYCKDPKYITDFFDHQNVEYTIKPLFGFYFESQYKYFALYEDNRTVDRISTKSKKFDYVNVMLCGKLYSDCTIL